MENLILLEDKRLNCTTTSGVISADDYLEIVQKAYENRGGIEGQRAPLKTKTAIVIRKRMIADVINGAILPAVVLGAVLTSEKINELRGITRNEQLSEFLRELSGDEISIIDGVQRTTALSQAIIENEKVKESYIRFELWASEEVGALIYRMLVLNTGQVPWDIKRQLETVYRQVTKKINIEIPEISLLSIDESSRRSSHGQYRAALVVEMFLAFTSRSPHVDVKEKVAEDFMRMDATEILAKNESMNVFIKTLKWLHKIDSSISNYSPDNDLDGRFEKGLDLFTSNTACVSFVASLASWIYGESGENFPDAYIASKVSEIDYAIDNLAKNLNATIGTDGADEFMDFPALNERLSAKVGKVGEFERDLFYRAFRKILEKSGNLSSMTICWSVRV